ncbi:MAG: aminotransferase class V-fold PLP-dependent enzyme [Isosphaeraceae bacterium]
MQDVRAVAAPRGRAASIVDGYQSVGSIEVDVRADGVDAYVGGCLKWLCGGPGAAFLWVRPEWRTGLEPTLTGWMSHVRPFDFSTTLERRDDAWRFLHGTPAIPAACTRRGPGWR